MLTIARLCIYITIGVAACRDTDQPPRQDAYTIAPAMFAVLSQKALTYQADFQLDAWAELLAADVEYHLPAGDSLGQLRGKAAVLAYWQGWKSSRAVREVQLSEFSIIPIRSQRALLISHLPGVHVSVICRQRVTYASGQVRARPLCLWLHFNSQKLIDRVYGFGEGA